MIKPTIGRVVLFTPSNNSVIPGFSTYQHDPSKPLQLAAIICYVHSDKMINVAAFDPNGVQHGFCSVTLIQDDDTPPEYGYYAQWMPYQKQVASGAIQPTLHT